MSDGLTEEGVALAKHLLVTGAWAGLVLLPGCPSEESARDGYDWAKLVRDIRQLHRGGLKAELGVRPPDGKGYLHWAVCLVGNHRPSGVGWCHDATGFLTDRFEAAPEQ